MKKQKNRGSKFIVGIALASTLSFGVSGMANAELLPSQGLGAGSNALSSAQPYTADATNNSSALDAVTNSDTGMATPSTGNLSTQNSVLDKEPSAQEKQKAVIAIVKNYKKAELSARKTLIKNKLMTPNDQTTVLQKLQTCMPCVESVYKAFKAALEKHKNETQATILHHGQ